MLKYLLAAFSVAATALEIKTIQNPQQKTLTRVTDPSELANAGYPVEAYSQTSYPCMFKLGNAFFDFTPFKLA